MNSGEQFGPLVWVAIVCIVVAASIVLWFLLAAPPLSRQTKVLLLFGIAVFPIGAAMEMCIRDSRDTARLRGCDL